jgi:AcrR family transcriptional regulator
MSAKTQLAVQVHPPRPRGRPKAEDVEALETRLILAARQTFVAHGYGATSISAVARAARVSKNTLYARFPSKADLFRAIVDDQIAKTTFAGEDAVRRGDKSLEGVLRRYAEHMLRASLGGEILQVNRLIYSEAGRFPELGQAATARMQVGVGQVADHIREFAARDGVACRDPEGAAEVLIMMLKGWYGDVMLTGREVTGPEIRDLVDRILHLFLAGRASW